MGDCRQCGYRNQDWATFCASCGAAMSPTVPEDRCIEFLLGEIPIWRRQGIIPSGSAARLERMYRKRLQHSKTIPSAAEAANVSRDRVVSPVSSEAQAPPQYPDASTSAHPPETPAPKRTSKLPSMTELLEAHWLKLLAAVAAAFIIAGVRQVMGVEWLQRTGVLLMPCVPIGLSAALIRFSVMSARPVSVGARACGGIGIALVSFAVTSINHRWLGDAVPQGWAIALASMACSGAGLGVLRATGDRTYEHYVLGFATLTAPLLALAALDTHSTLEARPWHLAASLAVIGSLHLGLAAQRRLHDRTTGDQQRETPFLWGSVALGVAAMLSIADAGLRGPTAIPAIMILAACAAVSGVAARLMASAELAVGSIGAVTLTGTFTVAHDPAAGSVEFGLLAVALGVLWIVLARTCADLRSQSGMPLSRPYILAALAAFCVAGALLALRLLGWADGSRLAPDEWPRCILLASLCGSAFAGMAARLRRPQVMFASAAAFAGAVALAFHRYLQMDIADVRREGGHDLALACLALVTVALAAHRRSPSVVLETVWPRTWAAPWAHVGAVLGAFGVADLICSATLHGADIGTWFGLLGVAAILLSAAYVLRVSEEAELPAILAGTGLATLSAATGLAGHVLIPKGGVTIGLMAATWVLVTSAQVTRDPFGRRLARPSQWHLPLSVIGTLTFAATLASVGSSPHMLSVQTLAIGAIGLALSPVFSRNGHPLSTSLSACAIGAAWLIAYTPGESMPGAIGLITTASLICALAYGRSAVQGFVQSAWLSAVISVMSCFGAVQWIGVAPQWTLLAMIPGLAAVFAVGEFVTLPEALRSPLRQTAVISAIAGIAGHELWQIASGPTVGYAPLHSGITDHRASAISIGAVATLLIIGTLRRRSGPWCLAACASATLATAHACNIAQPAPPTWAARFALCAMAYLPVMLAAKRHDGFRALSGEITAMGSVHAFLAYAVGLLSAGTPDQGTYSVLAIMLTGLTSVSLYALGRGSLYAHAGLGAFLTAYALYLYSRLGMDYGVLDLYLIPVGLYLLLLGHLADAKNRGNEMQALWWTGLSVTVFPTFVAFMRHFHAGGTAVHALLLVAECIAAIIWGIGHRIRAFVVVGATFALAFAIVLGSATARHLVIGAFALIVGLAMLAAVYHLSTRAAETRAWFARIRTNWHTWK